jgi:predicted dehydrogenase
MVASGRLGEIVSVDWCENQSRWSEQWPEFCAPWRLVRTAGAFYHCDNDVVDHQMVILDFPSVGDAHHAACLSRRGPHRPD